MKKLLITGVALVALLGAVAGCVTMGGVAGPTIDSINAQVMDQQAATDNTAGTMGVQVDIAVSDFQVSTTIGDNATGDGYYVYYMDKLPSSMAEEIPEFMGDSENQTTGEEMAWASTATSFTWDDVSQGAHVFSVQLVDNDGAPLSPVVAAGAALIIPAGEPATAPPTTTPPGTGETETVDLVIDSSGFDMTEIRVTAGAEVTVNLQNNDTEPHNFSVYENMAGTVPVFTGAPVQGGESITYTFTAPSTPGTYYFKDDEASAGAETYLFIVE
jgi:plastocyanin